LPAGPGQPGAGGQDLHRGQVQHVPGAGRLGDPLPELFRLAGQYSDRSLGEDLERQAGGGPAQEGLSAGEV